MQIQGMAASPLVLPWFLRGSGVFHIMSRFHFSRAQLCIVIRSLAHVPLHASSLVHSTFRYLPRLFPLDNYFLLQTGFAQLGVALVCITRPTAVY